MAPLALITGGSVGIGYELAKVFAKNGFDLALVAKNTERLEKAAKELQKEFPIKVHTFSQDLSLAESPEALYRQVKGAKLEVEILVNNAGFGSHGPFLESDLKNGLDMMQVNMVAPVHLTKLFLNDMKARGSGRILNVASTAAFQPGPTMALYYASKAFLLFFSEAIRDELRGSGVTVTALCPGATRTEFFKVAKMEKSRLLQNALMDATKVAEVGYRGLMKGQSVVIPGFLNRLMASSVGFFPRSLVTVVSRKAVESA